MAKPANLDEIRLNLISDIASARKLVAAARPLAAIDPTKTPRSLHVKQVYRVVELAFLGVVSEWETFIEETFVRYMMGAVPPSSGYVAPLSVGRSSSLTNSYEIISQNPKFDVSVHYLKFGDPKWTLSQANFYFNGGGPYAPIKTHLARLQEACLLRNRAAHSSEKCKTDFKQVALSYLMPASGKLTQGYRLGELLSQPATRHFGHAAKTKDYLEAFFGLYESLAKQIVP